MGGAGSKDHGDPKGPWHTQPWVHRIMHTGYGCPAVLGSLNKAAVAQALNHET